MTKVVDLFKQYEEGISLASALIQKGEIVAFPTETVYGLGADALRPEAVRSIFFAKGRPSDNPLIVHVSDMEMAFALAYLTQEAVALAEAFWPGPITLVLPKRDIVPYEVNAGLKSVALRMPDDMAALDLISRSRCPIAAPSANKSGKPSPTTAKHVLDDFSGEIPLVLDGGACELGVESTVILLTEKIPKIVRPGMITPEMIESVIGRVAVDDAVLKPFLGNQASSPGIKHKHYAPKAQAVLIEGEAGKIAQRVIEEYRDCEKEGKKCLILATLQNSSFYEGLNYVIIGDRGNPVSLCQSLYKALRESDEQGFDQLILEGLDPFAEGLAYMNRALRAVSFQVIRA